MGSEGSRFQPAGVLPIHGPRRDGAHRGKFATGSDRRVDSRRLAGGSLDAGRFIGSGRGDAPDAHRSEATGLDLVAGEFEHSVYSSERVDWTLSAIATVVECLPIPVCGQDEFMQSHMFDAHFRTTGLAVGGHQAIKAPLDLKGSTHASRYNGEVVGRVAKARALPIDDTGRFPRFEQDDQEQAMAERAQQGDIELILAS